MDGDVRLGAEEAERVLSGTEYWHYPFDLPWGDVSASKPGTDDRHEQRRRYFFSPLLDGVGGSLADKWVLDFGC